ncbi:MAG TPA: redoxin domain-containing protein [Burkholderiales bacterium]|nr:redoxin domain-containing protein [Burkholderiales bacterium]
MGSYRIAPELAVSEWLNAAEPITLASLRGKVIVMNVFQMHCLGCIHHSMPLAKRLYDSFDSAEVSVLGLHTVFESHDAATPAALAAFVLEQDLRFPIGIDKQPPDNGLPLTMRAYGMQGTPTTILIDTVGRIRMQRFGASDVSTLFASIDILIDEARAG